MFLQKKHLSKPYNSPTYLKFSDISTVSLSFELVFRMNIVITLTSNTFISTPHFKAFTKQKTSLHQRNTRLANRG